MLLLLSSWGGVSLILFPVYSLIIFPVFPPIVRFPTTCASLMIVFAISVTLAKKMLCVFVVDLVAVPEPIFVSCLITMPGKILCPA